MNKGLGIAVAGFGVAAVALTTPYFLGSHAEKVIHQPDGFGHLPAGVSARSVEYRRGWFGADAVTEVTFDLTDQEPVTFQLNHHIEHGPFSTGGNLYTVDTKLQLHADTPPDVLALWADGVPAQAHTTVDLKGAAHAAIRISPAARSENGGGFEWRGATADIRTSADGNHAVFTLASEGFSGHKPDGQVEIGSISADFDMQRVGLLWSGGGTFSIAEIAGSGKTADGDTKTVQLTGFEVRTASEIENGLVNGSVTYRVADVEAAGDNYSGEITVAMQNLDTAVLEAIQAEQERLAASELSLEERQMVLGGFFMEQFPKLLVRHPKLVVRDLRIDTPEGQVGGTLEVQYVKDEPVLAPVPALLGALEASADLRIPVALALALPRPSVARQVAAYAEASQEELSEEEFEQRVDNVVRQQVNSMIQAGFLQADGDLLTVNATLKDMVLMVNGRDMSAVAGL